MGLDYSIRTYVKKEKISDCLNWLYINTCVSDGIPFNILIKNEKFKINGESVQLNEYNFKYYDKNKVIKDFNKIFFTTTLVFDIDPKTIASIADWALNYEINRLEQFKDHFEDVYLGNGKIRIGGFESTITKLKNREIYDIEFTAVSSDMSSMLESSISVKKWILELSKVSDSLMTYLDLEHNGHKIMYYKGKIIDITIKEGFEEYSENQLGNLLNDYFEFTYNTDFED